jgi:CHASE2 domain-containing sensor protein
MANNRNVVLGMGYNGERSQTYTPDDIRSLVFLEKDAMADRLVFTEKTPEFAYQFFEPPVSDFTGSSRGVGVFDRETDNDGVVRHARLFYRSEVTYPQTANGRLPKNFGNAKLNDGAPVALPNLALISSVGTFDIDKWDVSVLNSEISMGGSIRPHVDIPIDDQGRMLIRYSPAGAQQQVSFADVMSGKVKSDFFRDKTVLIGATADGDEATDARVTPVGTRIPRVEITANAISTILDRSYVGWYDHKALGITIFVGLIAGLMLMLVSGARATALTLALMLGWLVVCYFAFSVGHLILPVISGLLIILIPYVVGLALALGPFRPEPVPVSPTYVPPPPGAVRNV